MEIRLDQLEERHFSWNEEMHVDIDELDPSDLASLGDVAVRGSIDTTTEGWVLRLALSYPMTLRCVRCLEPVDAPVEMETAFLMVLGDGASSDEDERELDREDLGVVLLDTPTIDTREIALEQMQLNVPMKPLCKDDCRGLCGRCGQNLNEGSCDCEPEVDSRWAALQALRDIN